MNLRSIPRELYQAALFARPDAPVLVGLRAGGADVTADSRDELLAKAVARQHVELEVDLLAYEQVTGDRNRNGVRFRDGAMGSLARSGVGKPFLRDHRQNDSEARGGTIIKSASRKVADGVYRLEQTVLLTEPAAVERALRGLMSTVSIGWIPTGPVLCSACGTGVYEECYHWPLDTIAGKDGEPDQVVEWIYTSAELVETSEVPVPAVPRARIEAVRAAMLAAGGDPQRGAQPHGASMSLLMKLLPILALVPTAGEDDAVRAVESLRERLRLTEEQRDGLGKQVNELGARLAGHEQTLSKQAADKFIDDAVRAGKVIPGSPFEASLRAFHGTDPTGASAFVASSPVVTPVGQPRQSAAPTPAPGAAGGTPVEQLQAAGALISQYNPAASVEGVSRALNAMGLKDPAALIAAHLGKGG